MKINYIELYLTIFVYLTRLELKKTIIIIIMSENKYKFGL